MIRFTSVADARFDPQFKDRVLQVYSLFPELQGRPIKCSCISKGSGLLGTARSWADPQQIALQPGVGRTTIAHELTHLLQGEGVPHGEKACDIWATARLPEEMLDEQPHYLLGHWSRDRWLRNRAQAKQLCAQAIEVRRTERAYIRWLSHKFKQLR